MKNYQKKFMPIFINPFFPRPLTNGLFVSKTWMVGYFITPCGHYKLPDIFMIGCDMY